MASAASQRWLRIIPAALAMYIFAFVDRTNISLALPAISRDLHLNAAQAGNAAGIFYWGYLVLQIPGGHLAKHWSAKKLIAILMVLWGASAAGCGFVRDGAQLLAMRFVLGVAEGGVFPAALIFLSHWFTRAERARANALWLLSLPGAVILSSPFTGWILDRWNWRLMLIGEGALPLVWVAVWLAVIADHPRDANWLAAGERSRLSGGLRAEAAQLAAAHGENPRGSSRAGWKALLQPQVLLLVAVYFCFTSGQMGVGYWLPSALESVARVSNLSAGVLNAAPYLVGAISMVLIGRWSDRLRERRMHVAGAKLAGGVCILAAVACVRWSPAASFGLIALSGIAAYGPMAPFWAIPTETLPASVVGAAMGFINGVGNLGAWAAPYIVGYLRRKTGGFVWGFSYLGLITCVGGLLALGLRDARSLRGEDRIATPQKRLDFSS